MEGDEHGSDQQQDVAEQAQGRGAGVAHEGQVPEEGLLVSSDTVQSEIGAVDDGPSASTIEYEVTTFDDYDDYDDPYEAYDEAPADDAADSGAREAGDPPASAGADFDDAEAWTHREPAARRARDPKPVLEFYAPSARGLEEMLADEIDALGVRDVRPLKTGVAFFGTLRDAYRVLLWSRLASRVQLILSYVNAADSDELYHSVRNIPWESHFDLETTFAVEARGTNRGLRNTQFTALRTKDAIVDRFREVCGERPTVSSKHPQIRIDVSIHGNRASVALDLSGQALHHRSQGGSAMRYGSSARESLAAGALAAVGWEQLARQGAVFVDPMCGSGALVIEAAMVACDMAPNLLRSTWGFDKWKKHDEQAWDELLAEADERAERGKRGCPPIIAVDPNIDSLTIARKAARNTGLDDVIDFRAEALPDLATIELPDPPKDPETGAPLGLVATIPPTGSSALSAAQRPALWAVLGQSVRTRFEGWRFALVTADPTVDAPLGMRATSVHSLPDGREDSAVRSYRVADDPTMRLTLPDGRVVFASEPGTGQFVDRLVKMRNHRFKWARHTGTAAFRIYDADEPSYNVAIDLYAGMGPDAGKAWVCVSEYAAPSEIDPERAQARLADALTVIPPILGVDPVNVFLKVRRRSRGGSQYASDERKLSITGITGENGMLFKVNLSDYLDTGLFIDQRETRKMVGKMAEGKHFLNLFAYTGAATVYAAKGGAASTTTVDLSGPYLDWARENMRLNGFDVNDANEDEEPSPHTFVKADVMGWVTNQRHQRSRWDLIYVDPPTFSNSSDAPDWDIERDHVDLLIGCSRLLTRNGVAIFSTNKRGFKPDLEGLRRGGVRIEDITARTIPQDFERNPRIHSVYVVRRIITGNERAHMFGDAEAERTAWRRREERRTERYERKRGGRGYDEDRDEEARSRYSDWDARARGRSEARHEREYDGYDPYDYDEANHRPSARERNEERARRRDERARGYRDRRNGGRGDWEDAPQGGDIRYGDRRNRPVFTGDGKYRGRLENVQEDSRGKGKGRGGRDGRGGRGGAGHERFEERGYDDRREIRRDERRDDRMGYGRDSWGEGRSRGRSGDGRYRDHGGRDGRDDRYRGGYGRRDDGREGRGRSDGRW